MIDAEKANYTISRMCRLLNIDRRRYYEWAKRRAAGPSAAEQRRAELTGKIVTAAKSSNIPIVELTEQMPEQYDSLTDWMAALVDAFSQAI